MSSEKFTQGEWVHCILGGEGGYPFVFENKTGEGVASVFIQQGDTEKGIANAALIAAAPEMYEFIRWIGSVEGQCAILTKDPGIVRKAQQIVKKARGEEWQQ